MTQPSPNPSGPLLLLTQGHAGDRLGARLLPALRARFPDREITGIGGERMQRAGVRLLARTDEISAMGWTGLLPILPRLLLAIRDTAARSRNPLPSCVVAVDVWQPLRFLHRRGPHLQAIPHVCYLPPAPNFTGTSRVHGAVSRAFASIVTPFAHQERLYREAGGHVRGGGHAGLQAMLEEVRPVASGQREPVLALLPGSRALEIRHSLSIQYEAARQILKQHPALQPVVCCANADVERQVQRLYPELTCSRNAREVMARAQFGIICSGTAALEAAVLGCPGVVTYHGSPLQRWEWRTFHVEKLTKLRADGIASPYVALPNIIAGEELYPEVLDAPAQQITAAALRLLGGNLGAIRTALDRVTASLSWEDPGQVVAEEAARVSGIAG
jgi:lipid-A-disaccharide synthase